MKKSQKKMRPIIFILLLPFMTLRFFCLGLFFICYVFIGFILKSILRLTKYARIGLIEVSKCFYHLLRYALEGTGITLYVLSDFFASLISYSIIGILILSIDSYELVKYAWKGLTLPYIFLYNSTIEIRKKNAKKKQERLLKEAKEKELRRIEKERIMAEKLKREEEIRKQKEKDVYINENVKLEKKTTGEKIDAFLRKLIALPKAFVNKVRTKLYNSSFAKDRRNKKDIQRNALLIDFEGEDAVKSETKQLYEYEAADANGKYVKGYFEAFSKVEVHSYLLSEGYTVYSIRTNKWIQRLHALERTSNVKIKNKDLIFFLTQLSTYIKAGIPLVDSLRILERQYKNKSYKRIFKKYDL